MNTSPAGFDAPIAEQIWDGKYRLKDADGAPIDLTVEDTWRRVARGLAQPEIEEARDVWEDRFYAALEGFRFLPGGRIVAGCGTDRRVTLNNCYVSGRIDDSLDSIFIRLREAAMTLQQGGGIGYDFSEIRPKGSPVIKVGSDASGPLSFMDTFDAMCRTIKSAGARRGAQMATMRCDHPDIESFVTAKRDPARLRMFNLSVLVTDDFMAAVEADAEWDLVHARPPATGGRECVLHDGRAGYVHRTVMARDLWDMILRSTYDYAEPGVIFIDRVNRMNNLRYAELISATNPCGEQPLPPFGACLLGSINLSRMVVNPFEPDSVIDEELLADTVRTAIRMMDNVIEVSNYPLPEQLEEARAKRRLGLGLTGLADMLIMLGLRYGSDEAVRVTGEVSRLVAREAILASVDLAKERGAFPLFRADAYLESGYMAAMDEDVRDAVRAHGVRNALVTSIAPTGTISLYAGNVSSGIEPVFGMSYMRKVLQDDGTRKEEEVTDYAVGLWRKLRGAEPFADCFVTAQDLSPEDHLRMQGAVQRWVDSSISKTINLPEDISFEAFRDVYDTAWKLGCKGCTTYRPNDVTGSVLEMKKEPAESRPVAEAAAAPASPAAPRRPDELQGSTYKVKWPQTEHALYVTINDAVSEDGSRAPFEVFFNSKSVENRAWTDALALMISAVFRRGGDVGFVASELKSVSDARGGAFMNGRYVASLPEAIGDVVARHLASIGGKGAAEATVSAHGLAAAGSDDRPAAGSFCNKCNQPAVIRQGGCETCTNCGDSKCG